MTGINLGRVLLGGLVAGLVINAGEFVFNTLIFADRIQGEVSRLAGHPVTGGRATALLAIQFGLGIGAVWLYAAMRPRFGPGMATGALAGGAAWGMSYGYMAATCIALGIFPGDLLFYGAAWGLPEIVAGTVAGASLYQEGPAGALGGVRG